MLFQIEVLLLNILSLVVATIILSFAIFGLLIKLISKEKALEKKYLILLSGFIAALFFSLLIRIISLLLGFAGDGLILIRLDNGGFNYLIALTSILGLLLVMALNKYFLDISWEKSFWVSVSVVIILYIVYSIIPEYYTFTGFGL